MTLDIRNCDRLGAYLRAAASVIGNAVEWKRQHEFTRSYTHADPETNTWAFPRWQEGLASLLHNAADQTPAHEIDEWADLLLNALCALPGTLFPGGPPRYAPLSIGCASY